MATFLLYLVFSCIMDSPSMILLTKPIFWPIIAALHFGLSPDNTNTWLSIIA